MMNKIVLDLEMCKVFKGQKCKEFNYSKEIIEIGAVRINEKNLIIDTFKTYVRPEYGWLTYEIERLTGIKEENIIWAPTFNQAIILFSEWIEESDELMITWSSADTYQLNKEMNMKNIVNEKITKLMDKYIDCQVLFSEKISSDTLYKLSEALSAAQILPYGREHDGLSDAYNTAVLYSKIMDDVKIDIPVKTKRISDELGFSLESIINKLNFNAVPA